MVKIPSLRVALQKRIGKLLLKSFHSLVLDTFFSAKLRKTLELTELLSYDNPTLSKFRSLTKFKNNKTCCWQVFVLFLPQFPNQL